MLPRPCGASSVFKNPGKVGVVAVDIIAKCSYLISESLLDEDEFEELSEFNDNSLFLEQFWKNNVRINAANKPENINLRRLFFIVNFSYRTCR